MLRREGKGMLGSAKECKSSSAKLQDVSSVRVFQCVSGCANVCQGVLGSATET